MKWNALIITVFCLLFAIKIHAQSESNRSVTLNNIIQRGYLTCGVSQGLAGFSSVDNQGKWQGLDVDFCRAVAAATLGDAQKVKFIPLSAKQRFTSLQSGDIDILSRNTTWTYLRDTTLGLNFIGIIYFDSQGFMVKKSSKVNHAKELEGAIICTNSGTTSELNITDFFKSANIQFQLLTFEKTDEAVAAYEMGRCDAYSTDLSGLAAQRLKLANANEHLILPDKISKEPFSPMARQGDEHWTKILRWILFALINAEEMNLTQQNIASQYTHNKDFMIERILGKQTNFAGKIGLRNDWVYQIILQVGNYADIYDRNVGKMSPLKIERGINALWDKGGLLYAPPFR